MSVAGILAEACRYDHPGLALSVVKVWAENAEGVAQILKEKETFDFEPANIGMRVLCFYFVNFSIDKLEHPEFFCWTGAWMAGERAGETSERLFRKYLSLYTDSADGNEIYPRRIPGIDEKALSRTLNIFHGNIVHYDLVRQWIIQDRPFSYKFEWLSDRHSNESIASGRARFSRRRSASS